MGHELIKSFIITELTKMIMIDFNLDEKESLNLFYETPTAKLLNDDSLGLYGDSPLYIYSSLVKEDIEDLKNRKEV